jgi:NADH:ubiquinone oxidoreductase subunit F (NADH-binding)/NADH:ubiquinone oxidoreductase subunit E
MTNKNIVYNPIQPRILELAAEHGNDPEAVLEILKEIQAEHGGLSRPDIIDTARALGLPAHQAYGMATFYSMLSLDERRDVLRVCDGPVCWLKRASVDGWKKKMPADDWTVERTSCLGLCDRAPALLVNDEQAGPATSGRDATRVTRGWRGTPTDTSKPRPREVRVMMRNAGKINPDEIESALEFGAYEGLRSALKKTPKQVIAEVGASGLQGRGGAGFPTWRKWRFAAEAARAPKYVVCNADESEPLMFKDRVLMDTNPQQLLEGMAIAGYACGAQEAFIYVRGEYEYQARRLEKAIQQAESKKLLGGDILDSGFSFHIHVHRGAGAYICGEETALIESLEGKRGEPRLRPPFPPQAGYRGLPTLVNNVETFSVVPHILRNGADWYCALSRFPIPGTRLYVALGQVNRPGLFEAPFGLTLGQVLEFAGGMQDGNELKFALAGGASGMFVPAFMRNVCGDFIFTRNSDGQIGPASFMFCGQGISSAALLREILRFFASESCGKCTPCRAGAHRSLEILTRITCGRGHAGDVEELLSLAELMKSASFCGLGMSVANPVLTAIKYFPDEFH